METSEIPVNKPVEFRDYKRYNYILNRCAVIIAFGSLITQLYFTFKNNFKKPGYTVCSRFKNMRISRSRDICKVWQYFSLFNKGELPVTFEAIQLKLTSGTRRNFELVLDADNITRDNRTSQLDEWVVSDAPLAGIFCFSASVDSAELSNLPTGWYTCTLQGIIDSAGRAVDLKKYSIYLNDKDGYSLRGIRRRCRRGIKYDDYTTYPIIELPTN